MQNLKMRIAVALALTVFFASITPIRATDYNPGVTTGQWVKYGNMTVVGSSPIPDANQTDWMKLEVTDVSGKNITLHMSGAYKNGTAAPEQGIACNIETGWGNMTDYGGNVYVIATNLQQNDVIPGMIPLMTITVNSTETRTYLSTDRTVNIVNLTMSSPGFMDQSFFMVYDKISGMLLEVNVNVTITSELIPTGNTYMSFSATDTNIFGSNAGGGAGWLQDNMLYVATIIIVIIVVVVAAVILMRKKKPSTTEPPTKSSTTET